MILMNFISRVNYNDPFSPLDYDLFRKIQVLCGVTADYFELVRTFIAVRFCLVMLICNCLGHLTVLDGRCGHSGLPIVLENPRQLHV